MYAAAAGPATVSTPSLGGCPHCCNKDVGAQIRVPLPRPINSLQRTASPYAAEAAEAERKAAAWAAFEEARELQVCRSVSWRPRRRRRRHRLYRRPPLLHPQPPQRPPPPLRTLACTPPLIPPYFPSFHAYQERLYHVHKSLAAEREAKKSAEMERALVQIEVRRSADWVID